MEGSSSLSLSTGVSGNVICVSQQFYLKHTSLLKPGDVIVCKRPPHESDEPLQVASVSTVRSMSTHPSHFENKAVAICTIDSACLLPDHLVSFRSIQHNGKHVEAWVPANSSRSPRTVRQTSNAFHISPVVCTLSLEHMPPSACYALAGCCVPVPFDERLDRFVLVTDHNDHNKSPLDHSWITVNTTVPPFA